MNRLTLLVASALVGVLIFGCEGRKVLSRDEIPFIKESLRALETVIKLRDAAHLDSILSSDAGEAGTTAQGVLQFVYADSLQEFVGFTHKQIFFRGDVARVDCDVSGPNGPARPVTVTLRKEDDEWLIKKVEPRVDEPLKDSVDSIA
jgi:hypothetical protein